MPFAFPHENLDVYRLTVEVARWFRDARWPTGSASLRDQGLRAIQSTALNIAEGCSNTPRARANHFRIALASAAEASAVLDLVDLAGSAEAQSKLHRIGTMLKRLR